MVPSNEKLKVKPSVRKRKCDVLSDAVKELSKLTKIVVEESPENEHDIFANYVSVSLKQLPLASALMAQHEIQGILMKHRLENISSSVHPHSNTKTSTPTYALPSTSSHQSSPMENQNVIKIINYQELVDSPNFTESEIELCPSQVITENININSDLLSRAIKSINN